MPVKTPSLKPTSDQVFLAVEGAEPLEDAYLWPIERIVGSEDQPRDYFDEQDINEIAASMKQKRARRQGVGESGFIQPILARWAPGAITESGTIKRNAKIVIIAGEKRFHAARRAGLDKVPVNIVDESEDEAYEDALRENLLRGDMTPTEIGQGFLSLMNRHGFKKYPQLARYLYGDTGRADYIRGLIAGLNLGEDAAALVTKKKQSAVAARRISTVKDPEQRKVLIDFMAGGGTVRELEAKIKKIRAEQGYAPGQRRSAAPLAGPEPTKLGTPKPPGLKTLPRFSLELALDAMIRHASETYDAMQPPITLTKEQRAKLRAKARELIANAQRIEEFLTR